MANGYWVFVIVLTWANHAMLVNLWEFYFFIFTKGRCDQLAELIQRSSLVTKSLGPVNMTSGTGDCRKTEKLQKNFVKKNWSAEYQELNTVSHTLPNSCISGKTSSWYLSCSRCMKPNHSATWNLLNCFSWIEKEENITYIEASKWNNVGGCAN